MKKIIALVLSFLLIFLFASCNNAKKEAFPDLYEVLEKGIGVTEKEFTNMLGSLGEKEKSYLQHHYGDIYFPNLKTAYPDDAQSYKGEESSVYLGNYKFSPRTLFVARSQTDKTKELASVSYSLNKPLNELYYAAKDFHKEFLEKYPNASYDKSFDDILYSKETFENAFNEKKEIRHIYTEKSVGIYAGKIDTKKNIEPEKTGYRNVAVMVRYQDDAFPGGVTVSIHNGFQESWYKLNIVYQKEVLTLKYRWSTCELYYKYGEYDGNASNYELFGSDLFALDF